MPTTSKMLEQDRVNHPCPVPIPNVDLQYRSEDKIHFRCCAVSCVGANNDVYEPKGGLSSLCCGGMTDEAGSGCLSRNCGWPIGALPDNLARGNATVSGLSLARRTLVVPPVPDRNVRFWSLVCLVMAGLLFFHGRAPMPLPGLPRIEAPPLACHLALAVQWGLIPPLSASSIENMQTGGSQDVEVFDGDADPSKGWASGNKCRPSCSE